MAYRSLLVACLLAAGCPADYETFAAERERLDCEITAVCADEPAMCDDISAPQKDRCTKFYRRYADACLEDMEDWLRRVELDPQQCTVFESEACDRVEERRYDGPRCNYVEGRPLREAGAPLLAEVIGGEGWAAQIGGVHRGPAEAGLKWLEIARFEHASIAAFSTVALELLGLGAPPELVEDCHRAALDEVAHARAALGVARGLLGKAVDLGALPRPAARAASLRTLALEAFVEGCIGEATAAARAEVAARRAAPPIAAVLRTIAGDETRHAALAWATVRWALARDASLMPALVDALDRHRRWDEAGFYPELPTYGLLPRDEHARIHRDVVDQIVAPILGMMRSCRRPTRSSSRPGGPGTTRPATSSFGDIS